MLLQICFYHLQCARYSFLGTLLLSLLLAIIPTYFLALVFIVL